MSGFVVFFYKQILLLLPRLLSSSLLLLLLPNGATTLPTPPVFSFELFGDTQLLHAHQRIASCMELLRR